MTSSDQLLARVQVLEDIEDIRKLKAAYCAACDDDHNGDAVAALFVPDGVWESGDSHCVGHDAMREFMFGIRNAGFMARSAHQVSNPVIEVDGDTATGAWRFLMMYTVVGDESFMRIIGRYEDTYVRTAEGWRFASLNAVVEERGEYEANTNGER